MSRTVRAKFSVSSVELWPYGGRTVKMNAVTSGSEENKAFWNATPSGRLEIQISNPDASDFFELGKEYYMDFQAAE